MKVILSIILLLLFLNSKSQVSWNISAVNRIQGKDSIEYYIVLIAEKSNGFRLDPIKDERGYADQNINNRLPISFYSEDNDSFTTELIRYTYGFSTIETRKGYACKERQWFYFKVKYPNSYSSVRLGFKIICYPIKNQKKYKQGTDILFRLYPKSFNTLQIIDIASVIKGI